MFNLFKKKNNNNTVEVLAPLTGTTVAIEEVPDPVFSEKMMGEGIAIKPTTNTVVAPFKGTVKMIMPNSGHAVGLVSEAGLEVLIHVGMDTVSLEGEGFEVLTEVDAKVEPGDPLIKFDTALLESKGMDTLTMIVVTNPGDLVPDQFLTNNEVKAAEGVIMVYKK